MILLKLFLRFLIIGTVSFGGGFGMISLIRETVISEGWLTESEFMNFIAVSESTPGPIAVNIATFVGSSQAGLIGALLATLGVVLPSFIIILLISAIIKNLLKYKGFNAFMSGVRPCVVAMILGTFLIMSLEKFFNFSSIGSSFTPEWASIVIFALIALTAYGYKKIFKKSASPIALILFSAGAGIIAFGL